MKSTGYSAYVLGLLRFVLCSNLDYRVTTGGNYSDWAGIFSRQDQCWYERFITY